MIYHFFNILFSTILYFVIGYIEFGNLYTNYSISFFFPFFVFINLIFSIYFKPINFDFRERSKLAILQFIFTIFSLSLIVSLTNINSISRQFIFLIVFFSVLVRWFAGFFFQNSLTIQMKREKNQNKIQYKRIFLSFIILVIAFVSALYFKAGAITYYPWLEQISLLLISLWWLSGYSSRKFYVMKNQNIYYKIGPIIKSHFFLLLFSSFFYYFLQLDYFSRQLLYGTIGIFALFETILSFIVFIKNNSISTSNISFPNTFIHADKIEHLGNKNFNNKGMNKCIYKLRKFIDVTLIDLINKNYSCNNPKCPDNCFLYLNTKKIENFNHLKNQSHHIIINLEMVNNMLSINQLFLTIRDKINPQGILLGSFSPLEEDYKRLRNKMPKFLYTIISPFHFLFYRIFPKIPFIGSIYDSVTRGKGRILSKAEVYGRLSYCGYHVEDSIMIKHKIFFIARPIKSISKEINPSYGPLVKLKRMGLDGEIINVYKLRTMHPYSEFIQKEIFDNHKLDSTGKIKNDFRITTWGKILRKLWIDELPQLYNWIIGDLSIVGVRALSLHYFSLYPKDLQELRTRVKPGLVPPYYADMPKDFNEIIESERKYLEMKLDNGFTTDIIYFVKAFNNIVRKGARSQ